MTSNAGVLERVTARFAAWVLDTPRWKFLTVLFAVMLVKTGLTFVAPATVAIAKDPFANPFPHPWEHYQMWSWLGPLLAHLVGATKDVTFTLFYLVFSVLFTVLMVHWLFRTLDEQLARIAVLVFALVPVSATAYYWVFTDALTLFLMACALYFPRTWIVVFLIGAALGMQHFEQASLAAAAAAFALAWTARRGHRLAYDWRWAVALLAGTIAGKVALVVLFDRLGIEVNSGRLWYVVSQWRVMLKQFLASAHFALFSTFAVGWLVVLPFVARRSPEARPFLVAILGLLLLLPISKDPTRVYAIVTFPLVCVFVLRNADFLRSLGRQLIGLCAVLWLLVPWMFVWESKPLLYATPYDVYEAIYHLKDPADRPSRRPLDPRGL